MSLIIRPITPDFVAVIDGTDRCEPADSDTISEASNHAGVLSARTTVSYRVPSVFGQAVA